MVLFAYFMNRRVLILVKSNSEDAKKVANELTKWLRSHSYEIIDVSDGDYSLTKNLLKNVCLGIVIGGDGTFLSLVRRLAHKTLFPIMGVNLGSVGFITEIGPEEMLSTIGDILKGKYDEKLRMLIRVEIWRSNQKILEGMVFNDAVLSKDVKTSILTIDVILNGDHLISMRTDGFVVSTPIGSTAYCLSAHGPILHPDTNSMVLVPICAHSLSVRPIVVPMNAEIEIILKEPAKNAYLILDGQVDYEVLSNDKIKVGYAEDSLKMVGCSRHRWSEALRTKLNMV